MRTDSFVQLVTHLPMPLQMHPTLVLPYYGANALPKHFAKRLLLLPCVFLFCILHLQVAKQGKSQVQGRDAGGIQSAGDGTGSEESSKCSARSPIKGPCTVQFPGSFTGFLTFFLGFCSHRPPAPPTQAYS